MAFNRYEFGPVVPESTLCVEVTQRGDSHRVSAALTRDQITVKQWAGDEIEEMTVKERLQKPGTYLLTVVAHFFGPQEDVFVRISIVAPGHDRVDQWETTLRGSSDKPAQFAAALIPVSR